MLPQWLTAFAGLGTIYLGMVLLLFMLFFRYYFTISQPLTGTVEWIYRSISDKEWNLLRARYFLKKADVFPILAIVAIFVTLAFGNYFGAEASDYSGFVVAHARLSGEIPGTPLLTNPPFGYLINSLSYSVFGETPLGGGFITAAFGIFLLVVVYIIIKTFFGKTTVAVCGTLLLGFDFMRFVESGAHSTSKAFYTSEVVIAATFILLSFLFMYRFFTTDKEAPLRKNILPLAMSGLFFGFAFSVVWAAFYFGFGLLAIFIVRLLGMRGYYRVKYPNGGVFKPYLIKILLITAPFFIIIPAVIYIFSYILYGMAHDVSMSLGDIISAHRTMLSPPASLLAGTDASQGIMFYTLGQQSLWEAVFNARPQIIYESFDGNSRSMVMLLGNPVVWWGGFLAMIAMVYRVFRQRDVRALVILCGYLGTLLPWVIWFQRSRILFFEGQPISIYLLSVPFLVLGFSHIFNTVISRGMKRSRQAVYLFTGAAGAAFAMFYPALIGLSMPLWFFYDFLSWLPGRWPFRM